MASTFGFITIGLLRLEGDLLALEAAATTATATEAAAATTTTTTTSTTEAATAAATTATTAAETATATTATTTAATVVVTGLGEVKTNWSAVDISAVELLESVLGIIDGVERDIGEALGTATLPVDVVSMHEHRKKGVRQVATYMSVGMRRL